MSNTRNKIVKDVESLMIKVIKNESEQRDNIVLIGSEVHNFRQLADDVKAIISNDLSSFRLTMERLYGLIR